MSSATAYKRAQLSDAYDTIVIGSGIGGLAAASMLARHRGHRVLVLERHYTAGGFTHSFQRPGFDWDVGVHYIGGVNTEGSGLHRMFAHLSDGALAWADMGEVYDRVRLGERVFDFVRGAAALEARLSDTFPAERAGIGGYFAQVQRATRAAVPYFTEKILPRALSLVAGPLLRYRALGLSRHTTQDVVNNLVRDPDLRGLLTAHWGDYGLPPSRSSFLAHALVTNHYLDGAAYPVGGASRIAAAIIPSIERAGGAVVVRAEVARIVVERGRAVGVELVDGRRFSAARVVSDAGAAVTYGRLLPRELVPFAVDATGVDAVEPSVAHLSLYVGMRGSAASIGLPKHNVWAYPSADHDGNYQRVMTDDAAPLAAAFLSFASARDPDFERRHPGHSTAEVVTFVPARGFDAFRGSRRGKRGDAYDRRKDELSAALLEVLYREIPGSRGTVVHAELSTPLTTTHFSGHPHGEAYGLAHSPRRFDRTWLRPQSPVPGLFLAGADVCTVGVSGSLIGGLLCASAIARSNMLANAERGVDATAGAFAAGDGRGARTGDVAAR